MLVKWSKSALADYKAIIQYIQADDPPTADSIARRIWDATKTLESFPYAGRSGKRHGTRELIVPKLPYIVIYRVEDEFVHVLRLFDSRQNWISQI